MSAASGAAWNRGGQRDAVPRVSGHTQFGGAQHSNSLVDSQDVVGVSPSVFEVGNSAAAAPRRPALRSLPGTSSVASALRRGGSVSFADNVDVRGGEASAVASSDAALLGTIAHTAASSLQAVIEDDAGGSLERAVIDAEGSMAGVNFDEAVGDTVETSGQPESAPKTGKGNGVPVSIVARREPAPFDPVAVESPPPPPPRSPPPPPPAAVATELIEDTTVLPEGAPELTPEPDAVDVDLGPVPTKAQKPVHGEARAVGASASSSTSSSTRRSKAREVASERASSEQEDEVKAPAKPAKLMAPPRILQRGCPPPAAPETPIPSEHPKVAETETPASLECSPQPEPSSVAP